MTEKNGENTLNVLVDNTSVISARTFGASKN